MKLSELWNKNGTPPVGCLVEIMDISQSETWGDAISDGKIPGIKLEE